MPSFYYNVADILDDIQRPLQHKYGALCNVVDTRELAEAVIAHAFSGVCDPPPLLIQQYTDYGLPTEKAVAALHAINATLHDELVRAVRQTYSLDAYDITTRLTSQDEVVITLQPKPTPSTSEQLRREVEDALANGDYVPESLRRLVGASL